jgi:polyhydroxyalkanoate synthase
VTTDWISAWERAAQVATGWMAGLSQMQQVSWTAAMRHLELVTYGYARLAGRPAREVMPPDARFEDQAWRESLIFDAIKQSYLVAAQWILEMTDGFEDLSPEAHKRIRFWTQQAVDAMSPANFALTNPVVLQETLRTGGMSLARGMQNLLADLQVGRLRMVPDGSFRLGTDLACTPGKVVYRNSLIELIQYTPTTERVRAVPILVIPPWINKYYVMDLRPQNSMFKFLVDSGFTLLTISWKNPSRGDAVLEMDFSDYLEHGPLDGLRVVRAVTGAPHVSLVGYCAGGILLQATLAYLAAGGADTMGEDLAAEPTTATLFASHHDFADIGDLEVFISQPDVQALEWLMRASGGYLDGRNLAATFNMLRANDLLWHFVVHNYLLGKEPPAFDMLYWNGDGTRVPAPVHSFLLREFFLGNKLKEPNGISVRGVGIDVRRIATPTYAVAGSTDHIVPWRGAFQVRRSLNGPVRFVLAESGHIAGIINPPASHKRSYWTNDNPTPDPEQWLEGATRHAGSWWGDWIPWLEERSGEQVSPPLSSADFPPLADAPGNYVLEQ